VPLISAHVSALLEHHVEVPLIRRSMNGSEAVARGCALHAAMALPTFNDSRRIRLTDTTPYDSK
jgi:molecular chaperone DnaK (HSP70)